MPIWRSVLVALLLIAAPAAGGDLGLPVGDFIVTFDETFSSTSCEGMVWGDSVDVFLGVIIDFSVIDEAWRNGSDGLARWQASLVLWNYELIEVELLTEGATDLDDDPLAFDVALSTPILGSTEFVPLVRLRLTPISPEDLGQLYLEVAGLTGSVFGSSPGWFSADSADGCGTPCPRQFRQRWTVNAGISGTIPFYCNPDAACGVYIEHPVGGEIWRAGSEHLILYSTIMPTARLEYSTDGGQNWTSFHSTETPEVGWVRWMVPGLEIPELQLRGCGPCALGCDGPIVLKVTTGAPTESTSWGALKSRF